MLNVRNICVNQNCNFRKFGIFGCFWLLKWNLNLISLIIEVCKGFVHSWVNLSEDYPFKIFFWNFREKNFKLHFRKNCWKCIFWTSDSNKKWIFYKKCIKSYFPYKTHFIFPKVLDSVNFPIPCWSGRPSPRILGLKVKHVLG